MSEVSARELQAIHAQWKHTISCVVSCDDNERLSWCFILNRTSISLVAAALPIGQSQSTSTYTA